MSLSQTNGKCAMVEHAKFWATVKKLRAMTEPPEFGLYFTGNKEFTCTFRGIENVPVGKYSGDGIFRDTLWGDNKYPYYGDNVK